MGNKILKDYDVEEHPFSSGGICMYWKIIRGKQKKSGLPVSVWVLEKDDLPKQLRNEQFYNRLRAEAANLMKIRHPFVLEIHHPLDESRKAFVMITQPLRCSLANAMKDFSNLKEVPAELQQIKLSGLDIKNGLRQVAEALNFCHRDARMYHLNVDPSSIMVLPNGDWKLCGFSFAVPVQNKTQKIEHEIDYHKFGSETPMMGLPSFNYVSPEVAMEETCDHRADVFSLAKIAYELHKVMNEEYYRTKSIADVSQYSRYITAMLPLDDKGIPDALMAILPQMLSKQPEKRMDLDAFLKSEFLNDVQIRTLKYLDTLMEKTMKQRVEFLKRLPQALHMFDAFTAEQRILPALMMQVQDDGAAVFALPPLVRIASSPGYTREKFRASILPGLAERMKADQSPQMHYTLIKHLSLFMKNCSRDEQMVHIIPMVVACLESQHAQLRALTLDEMIPVATSNLFDFGALKGLLLPRILEMAHQPGPLSNRVKALICLSKIFHLFDTDAILSILEGAVTSLREHVPRTPAIMMCCVGLMDAISKNMGNEVTVVTIIPSISPLLIEEALNRQQLTTVLTVMRGMLTRVEEARKKNLENKEYLQEKVEEVKASLHHAPTEEDDLFQRMEDISSLGKAMSDEPTPQATAQETKSSFDASASDGVLGAMEEAAQAASPPPVSYAKPIATSSAPPPQSRVNQPGKPIQALAPPPRDPARSNSGASTPSAGSGTPDPFGLFAAASGASQAASPGRAPGVGAQRQAQPHQQQPRQAQQSGPQRHQPQQNQQQQQQNQQQQNQQQPPSQQYGSPSSPLDVFGLGVASHQAPAQSHDPVDVFGLGLPVHQQQQQTHSHGQQGTQRYGYGQQQQQQQPSHDLLGGSQPTSPGHGAPQGYQQQQHQQQPYGTGQGYGYGHGQQQQQQQHQQQSSNSGFDFMQQQQPSNSGFDFMQQQPSQQYAPPQPSQYQQPTMQQPQQQQQSHQAASSLDFMSGLMGQQQTQQSQQSSQSGSGGDPFAGLFN